MTAFFYKNIPKYHLERFRAVRDVFDNLYNLLNLAEIINTCTHCKIDRFDEKFDFVIFSGEYCRALVRKNDGFFSMSIPFQVIDSGDGISFNFDLISEEVSGQFISMMRNAIQTTRNSHFSHDDIILSLSEDFSLDITDAIVYSDAFVSLVAEDHGYFRFDDDETNKNGDLHPRYHFDFFYKNTSALKVGSDTFVDINCFYSLFDGNHPKHYLRK